MSSGPNSSELSKGHVMWQIKESLSMLQLGYVGILYACF